MGFGDAADDDEAEADTDVVAADAFGAALERLDQRPNQFRGEQVTGRLRGHATAELVHEEGARADEVYLVGETMAAAIGAGIQVTEPSATVLANVGETITQVAVLGSAALFGHSVTVSHRTLDEAIAQHIRKTVPLLIGERTAAAIRMELGSPPQ